MKNSLESRERTFSGESDLVKAYTRAAGGVIETESSMQTDSDYESEYFQSARRNRFNKEDTHRKDKEEMDYDSSMESKH